MSEWLAGNFASAFRSFDKPLPDAFKKNEEDQAKDIPKRKVQLSSQYFLPFIWQCPELWTKYGITASSPSVDLTKIKEESFSASCPAPLIEGYELLNSQPMFIEFMHQALGDEDMNSDPVVKYALEELEYGRDASKITEKHKSVFPNELFWSILSNYCSVDLSCYNLVNNEHVARIVALHLIRHLYAYNVKELYPDEPPIRNAGWSKPRILVITPTKLHAKLWLERLRTIGSNLKPSSADVSDKKKRKPDSQDLYEALVGELSDMKDDTIDYASELGIALIDTTKRKNRKPLDYVDSFRGNNDDEFIFGLRLSRSGELQVMDKYENASIVVSSPSALAALLVLSKKKAAAKAADEILRELDQDDEGIDYLEKEKPEVKTTLCNWFSSIEVCVVDRADQLMQNKVDDLIKVMQNLNLRPENQPKGVDITKLRECHFTDDDIDLSVFYRQTIMLSQIREPILQAVMRKQDANHRGMVKLWRGHSNAVVQAVVDKYKGNFMSMVCERSPAAAPELFKRHFVESFHNRLFKDQVILLVNSHVEYLEVQELLKNGISTDNFLGLHEQTPEKDIANIRNHLKNGECPILLVTERFLYFRRYPLIGAFHLVCYNAPKYPSIFLELINDNLKAPRHVEDDKTLSSSHLALIYWDLAVDNESMERIVGARNMYQLSRSSPSQLVSLAIMGSGDAS